MTMASDMWWIEGVAGIGRMLGGTGPANVMMKLAVGSTKR